MLCNKKNHRNENPMHHCLWQLEKGMKTQHSQKEKNALEKDNKHADRRVLCGPARRHVVRQQGWGWGGAAEKGVEKSFGKKDQGLGRDWRPPGAEAKPARLERRSPIGTKCQPHVQFTIFW